MTGAARGIGKAIAHRLSGLGASTMIWDRDSDLAERTVYELRDLLNSQGRPHQLKWAMVDVSDPMTVEKSMAEAAVDGLDILVNNAAITPQSIYKIENVPLDLWDKSLSVNLGGYFYCCRVAIPYLRQRAGAAIVNISSSVTITGGSGGVHYTASKSGINGLTRHLARELAPQIRVNAIMPRSIDSDAMRNLIRAISPDPEAEIKRGTSLIPLGRLGRPEDIADVVVFLASDWASYITGQILLIDGGRTYT